jgi:hypothetical protein
VGIDKILILEVQPSCHKMNARYIEFFMDELVILERIDGSEIECIIQSSKNNLDEIKPLSADLQGLHEIIVTVKLENLKRIDFPIKISSIHSIERTV